MSATPPLPNDVLTVHEAGLMLEIPESRVRALIADGRLTEAGRFREFGHDTVLVPRAEVERLADGGPPGRA